MGQRQWPVKVRDGFAISQDYNEEGEKYFSVGGKIAGCRHMMT